MPANSEDALEKINRLFSLSDAQLNALMERRLDDRPCRKHEHTEDDDDLFVHQFRILKLSPEVECVWESLKHKVLQEQNQNELRCRGVYGLEVVGLPSSLLFAGASTALATTAKCMNPHCMIHAVKPSNTAMPACQNPNHDHYQQRLKPPRSTTSSLSSSLSSSSSSSSSSIFVPSPVQQQQNRRDTLVHIYGPVMQALYLDWKSSNLSLNWFEFVKRYATEQQLDSMRKNIVLYLNDHEAQHYKVTFGLTGAMWLNGKSIPNGYYMFVLDVDGTNLYIGPKRRGRFHHTSFVHGKPVLCAGFLKIKSGTVCAIQLHSGHYRPSVQHGLLLRKFFQSKLGQRKTQDIPMRLMDRNI